MNRTMKKLLSGIAFALGLSAVCSSSLAETKPDPFDLKALLAKAEDKALEAGGRILSDVGKNLLGAVLNSYLPGLGATLGLTKENTSTAEILAAIAADGEKTRTLMTKFWSWAAEHEELTLRRDYLALLSEAYDWNNLVPATRLGNRSRLDELVSDCKAVLGAYQSGATALERVEHLHAYLTLLSLTIPLAAEREELDYIGPISGATNEYQLEAWWATRTQSERESIAAQIDVQRRQTVTGLLIRGLSPGFEDHLVEMDDRGDFVAARDAMFSPLELTDPNTFTWTYYYGFDPTGYCRSKEEHCTKYTIKANGLSYNCIPGTLSSLYLVEFENGGQQCYPTAQDAYKDHKRRALETVILRVYGPARLMAEKLREAWSFGPPPRLGLDDTIEEYIDDAAVNRIWWLTNIQTRGDMTDDELTYLYSFVLTSGLSALLYISQEADNSDDWLDAPNPVLYWDEQSYVNATEFPSYLHISAMKAWPMSIPELDSHYLGLPTAKWASIAGALL